MTNNEIDIKINAELGDTNKQIAKLTKELEKLQKKANTGSLDKTQKGFDKTSQSAGKLTKSLTAMATAYVSLTGMKELVRITAEVEDGFIGVAKTTGLVGDDFERLKEGINDLSTELAGMDHSELQAIAESAGQLGIEGTENILAFTEVIAKVASTTDLSAEEASLGMQKLANSFKLPGEQVENLASAMNELSNTTTATVGEIVNYSQRMAGAASSFGLSTQEVLGFASTFTDLGINAEIGATAFSKILAKMTTDTAQFAEFVGLSMSEFKDIIDTEPVEAIELLAKKFGELDKYTGNQLLEDWKLSGIGVATVMRKLSTNTELLSKNIDISNKAWTENVSIQNEYETASKGLNAQLTKMKNGVIVLVSKLGGPLLDALKDVVDGTMSWYESLSEEDISKMTTGIQDLIDGFTDLGKTLATVYDWTWPDSLTMDGAEGSGVLSFLNLVIKSLGDISKMNGKMFDVLTLSADIEDATEKTDTFIESLKNLSIESLSYDGDLSKLTKAYNENKESLTGLLVENEKQQKWFKKQGGSDDAILGLKRLGEEEVKLKQKIIDITKAYEDRTASASDGAKKSLEAEKKYNESIKAFSGNNLDKLKESNDKRISMAEETLGKLKSGEEKYAREIAKIQEDLAKKIADIDKERANKVYSLENEKKDVEYGSLDEYDAYIKKQRDAEVELVRAKEALRKEDLAKFETHIARYKSLVTSAGSKAIETDGKIRISADKVKTSKIDGITKTQEAWESYYDVKERMATDSANKEAATAEASLKNTKAQIDAQIIFLEELGKLYSKLSGENITPDVSGLQKLSESIDTAEAKAKNLSETPLKVSVNTAEIEDAKSYISNLDNIATNGITLDMYADISDAKKEADQMVEYYNNIDPTSTLKIDPREAKEGIDTFVKETGRVPAIVTVEAIVKDLYEKMEKARQDSAVPIDQVVIFEARVEDLNAQMSKLEEPIHVMVNIESNIDAVKVSLEELKIPISTNYLLTYNLDELISQKQILSEPISSTFTIVDNYGEIEGDKKKLEAPTGSKHTIKDNSKKVSGDIDKLKTATTSTHSIKVNDSDAVSSINSLKQPTSSIHTVTVQTVEASSNGGLISQKLAGGGTFTGSGSVPGYDATDSDKVNARLTGGEFVIKRQAVDKYGVNMLKSINGMETPKFSSGGKVGDVMQNTEEMSVVNISIGGKTFQTITGKEIAEKLARHINEEEGM